MCVCVCTLTAAQLSQDSSVGGADEATASPLVNPKEQEVVDKKILDNQYKCFERMNREPQYNKSGDGCGSFLREGVVFLFCFVSEGSRVCFLAMLQVFTAAATGTAGCAGTTLRQEPPSPRTAPIILQTLTPQVSQAGPKTVVCQLYNNAVVKLICYGRFQKRPQSTAARTASGSATQTPTGPGPTTPCATRTPRPS